MTPKQKRFVQEYLVDLKATQAAVRAGYSKRTAASIGEENLRKPGIAEAIQQSLQVRSEAAGITAQGVLDDLRTLAEMCLGEKPMPKTVVVDDKTKDIEVKEVNPAGAARALELIGKHIGAFGRKVKLPTLDPAAPLKDQGALVMKAVAAGYMTIEDGIALMQLISNLTKLTEIDSHEQRIQELEEKLKEVTNGQKS